MLKYPRNEVPDTTDGVHLIIPIPKLRPLASTCCVLRVACCVSPSFHVSYSSSVVAKDKHATK